MQRRPATAAAALSRDRVRGADGRERRAAPGLLDGRRRSATLMWRAAGLFRTRDAADAALAALEPAVRPARRRAARRTPPTATAGGRRNLVTVARLIARAALRREESRGGHFRADFPDRDDIHWKSRH